MSKANLTSQNEAFIAKATYSVENNKLRLYPFSRLDAETYEKVKKAGFKWAPKQELFVAPKWTPAREDMCLELAGQIEPEGTTLAERGAAKAERLDAIADNKAHKANAFQRTADELSRAFEFGQPILVGHHSERKARKTQERMHSAMSKAVSNSKEISYWQYRAAGVEHHANRKNEPGVRARRIKTLLAELRDLQRVIDYAALALQHWKLCTDDATIQKFAMAHYPGLDVCSWDDQTALREENLTPEEVKIRSIKRLTFFIENPTRWRWIDHTLNRLAYEREMLGPVARFEGEITPAMLQVFTREQGALKPKATKLDDGGFKVVSDVELPMHLGNATCVELSSDEWRDLMQSTGYEVPAKKPAKPSILNFKAPGFETEKRYHRGEFEILAQVEMTKADYAKINSECRGTRLSKCGTFRFKVCPNPFFKGPRYSAPWVAVFLTDSKAHPAPDRQEPEAPLTCPVRPASQKRLELTRESQFQPRLCCRRAVVNSVHDRRRTASFTMV